VVVTLEGTLRVEGSTEHRVAAFPVRKAESAGAWFVEPWAYDLSADVPVRISSPPVDAEERATADPGAPLQVTVETAEPGTVWASFAGGTAMAVPSDGANPATFPPQAGPHGLVTVLFHAGPTLYATGFVATSDGQPTTSTTAADGQAPEPEVSLPFLDADTNRLLRACAAGDAGSCDAAQIPGVLDDGAFSAIHQRCSTGHDAFCDLLDNLVAAELRRHQGEGTAAAGCRTGPSTVPAGAVTKTVIDVDGDGRPDTAWIARGADGRTTIGVVTAAGGGAVRPFESASPVTRSILVADADDGGPVEVFASDGRSVQLWAFTGCDLVDVRDAQGAPYVFSLGFSGIGTGVGCVAIDGRKRLVGLDVTSDRGDTVEWSRTIVELQGATARNGATSSGTFTRPADDHTIDLLHQVTCGQLTMAADGLTAPQL
jgi:hypothetical protein